MLKDTLLFIACFVGFYAQAQCWQSANTHARWYASGIKSDGTLWVWGAYKINSVEQAVNSPMQVGSDNDWQMVSTGHNFRCAIKSNGTLWTWGSQNDGALGNGSSSPGNVSNPTQVGSDNQWAYVDCSGARHTLALKTDGTLWSWGKGSYGGNGTGNIYSPVVVPTQIGSDTDWIYIEAGMNWALSWGGVLDPKGSSIAIKANGSVWVWGNNEQGQLGNGTTTNLYVPTLLQGQSGWATVSTNGGRTMVVKTNGTLWGSGANYYGQLGNGTTTNSISFTQIGTDTDWQTVSSGNSHTLALKNDGSLWAWGDNYYGSLGNGNNTNSLVPIQIGSATDWVSISAGFDSSSAMKQDGTLWTWGTGSWGVLGVGPLGQYPFTHTPGQVSCQQLETPSFSKQEVAIYPNPATDFVNIELGEKQIDKVILTDLSSKEIMNLDGNHTKVDVRALAQGVYMIKILSDGKSYFRKLVRQ